MLESTVIAGYVQGEIMGRLTTRHMPHLKDASVDRTDWAFTGSKTDILAYLLKASSRGNFLYAAPSKEKLAQGQNVQVKIYQEGQTAAQSYAAAWQAAAFSVAGAYNMVIDTANTVLDVVSFISMIKETTIFAVDEAGMSTGGSGYTAGGLSRPSVAKRKASRALNIAAGSSFKKHVIRVSSGHREDDGKWVNLGPAVTWDHLAYILSKE